MAFEIDTSVYVDHSRRTARPNTSEGDDHYGLSLGTNGTAAATRRLCAAPSGYVWRRHDGRPAAGLSLSASTAEEFVNPWTLEESPL